MNKEYLTEIQSALLIQSWIQIWGKCPIIFSVHHFSSEFYGTRCRGFQYRLIKLVPTMKHFTSFGTFKKNPILRLSSLPYYWTYSFTNVKKLDQSKHGQQRFLWNLLPATDMINSYSSTSIIIFFTLSKLDYSHLSGTAFVARLTYHQLVRTT